MFAWKKVLGMGLPLMLLVGSSVGWWAARIENRRIEKIRQSFRSFGSGIIGTHEYVDLQDVKRRFETGEQVSPRALKSLGYYYKSLECRTPDDDKLIFRIFKHLANQRNFEARCELAWLYRIGLGTPTNLVAATAIYKKLHEDNHSWGTLELGNAYRDGIGVPKDVHRAVELYRLAARRGQDGGAFCELAEVYERGLLGETNTAEAIRLYRQSVQAKRNPFHLQKAENALKRLERAHGQGR